MGRLNRRNEGRAAILAALGIAAMASCQRADMSPGRVESTRVRPVVVIDGRFDEWGAARSTQFPAGGSVASVSSLSDSTAVYVALALRESTNLQGSASPLLLVFDADDDPATGVAAFGVPGADLVISFTALTEEGTAQGVVSWVPDPDDPERVTAPSRPFVPADLGLWFEPLHATDRIELRLARGGANGLFATEGFAGRIVVLEGGGAERERSPLFRHRAPAAEALTAEAEPRSGLDRAPEAEFRVLVWNVAGRLSSNPEPFRAILRAIDADLVLLDEVSARTDLAAVRAVLPGDPSEWSVHIGSSGGRQRGAVAARSPLTAAAEFDLLAYEGLDGGPFPEGLLPLPLVAGGIPATAAWVEMGARRVLAVVIDLVCCGNSVTSRQDRVRVLEAATVNRAARRAVASADGSAAAVILAGDFNLVGSETPLITAGRGLDTGGGDLEPIYALQLDGASTATWIGPSTPFPPGQLDYLLHPSSLEPLRAFVFETEDLGVADLATLGLSAELSDDASDHRPVVADFRWR